MKNVFGIVKKWWNESPSTENWLAEHEREMIAKLRSDREHAELCNAIRLANQLYGEPIK